MSRADAFVDADRASGGGLRRDTAVVTICILLSRITGLGRVLATAAVLGSGLLGDVYQSANLVPNLLFELAAGGVLQAVLVPTFVAAQRRGGTAALGDAVGATAGVIMAGLGIVAVVGMAASPLIANVLVASEPVDGVASDKLSVMVPMVLVFIPQLVCYGLAMVVGAALAARGRFVAAALAPAVNNIIVIAACIAYRQARGQRLTTLQLTRWEFVLIAGGTTLGVIAFSAIPAIVLSVQGVRWRPRLVRNHPAVRALRQSFGWATLSVMGTLVPMGAALVLGNGAPGGVAVFVYAWAFFVLPHALIAVPVATTLAPRVAHRWQDGDGQGVGSVVGAAMSILVPLLFLAGAGIVALAWPVARVAAFGQTASQGIAPIAHTLAAFGPGLVGYGVAFVMMRLLFALDDVRLSALVAVVGAVLGVVMMTVLSFVLADGDRAAALAIGYGTSQIVVAALLTARLRRLTGAMGARFTGRLVAESVAGAAAAAAAMLWLQARFAPTRRSGAVAILVAGVVGVVIFAGVLATLRRGKLLGAAELGRSGAT